MRTMFHFKTPSKDQQSRFQGVLIYLKIFTELIMRHAKCEFCSAREQLSPDALLDVTNTNKTRMADSWARTAIRWVKVLP